MVCVVAAGQECRLGAIVLGFGDRRRVARSGPAEAWRLADLVLVSYEWCRAAWVLRTLGDF